MRFEEAAALATKVESETSLLCEDCKIFIETEGFQGYYIKGTECPFQEIRLSRIQAIAFFQFIKEKEGL